MRNPAYIYIFLILIFPTFVSAQNITGKLVDEYGDPLAEIPLQLYTSVNNYFTTSGTDGAFIFDNVTGISDDVLPKGYSISNNYPNPFNPKTRIIVRLPKAEKVKVVVFNLLGEIILEENERIYSSGNHFFDLELNNSPSGIYFARVTIGNKYTVTKKMMLIYGSQHLAILDGTSNRSYKNRDQYFQIELETILDSIVAENSIIGRKVFKNLPSLTGNSLDLGNLTIERFCPETPTVLYEGKVYNTVKIGDQCWLRENLNVGTRIGNYYIASNNGIIEKYCYDDNPANCEIYGGLYQWEEAMQYDTIPGARGICPEGWHIPTSEEIFSLIDVVNGNGNALKAIGEGTGMGVGINSSGFSALLAGQRSHLGGFYLLGEKAYFWSSEREYVLFGYFSIYFGLHDDHNGINHALFEMPYGFCVRCIKD